MDEQNLRKLIRETLLKEQSTEEPNEIPWPQPQLFWAAGNGRGRGEYSLAAALAGATVDFDDTVSAEIAEKLKKFDETPPKIKGKTNPAWAEARDQLDAAGSAAVPKSIQNATGQGQTAPYDVLLTPTIMKAMTKDPKVSVSGTPQYMDANIEVKEPGPGNTFRMASEGMQFIATLRGTSHYMSLASTINDLQREYNKKLAELERDTQLDLFDPNAGMAVTQIPNGIQDFMRTDGKFFKEFGNIAKGEGAMIPARLQIMYDAVTAMRDFASASPPSDPVAELIYNSVKTYYNALLTLKNMYATSPELMSSQEVFFKHLLSPESADFENRPLFDTKANVKWIAFVTPSGYRIFPTDMKTLFEKGLLTLYSISQGRPKFKIGSMVSLDETESPSPEAPVQTPDIPVPDQLTLALENARLVRRCVRSLLKEDLTKSDKKEMERIAKKQAKKYFNNELDKALGTSFFGYKGKVSKFVEDEVSNRFKAGAKDKDFTDAVEKVAKRVLQALYTMHYKRRNLIKDMPVPKG